MIELDTFASSQLSIIFLIGTFPCKSYIIKITFIISVISLHLLNFNFIL